MNAALVEAASTEMVLARGLPHARDTNSLRKSWDMDAAEMKACDDAVGLRVLGLQTLLHHVHRFTLSTQGTPDMGNCSPKQIHEQHDQTLLSPQTFCFSKCDNKFITFGNLNPNHTGLLAVVCGLTDLQQGLSYCPGDTLIDGE